jgi:hypothetical protein
MNYSYAQQPVQAVAPTAGNVTNSALMPQANSLQQSVVQQPLNTTTPQLQQIQQQYVSQIPTTATPTAPVDRLSLINTSTVGGIDQFVKEAYNMSQAYTTPQVQAQAVAPAVAPQVVSPAQQVLPATTPLGQTQVPQQTTQTVQPATGTATQTQVASNPQVATTTAQQTQQLKEGMSDGQGRILMRNRQTGQFEWRLQEEVLAMYQAGKQTGGSVQLPDGTWVKEATVKSAIAKLEGRLAVDELVRKGAIDPQKAELLYAGQKLDDILAQATRKRMERPTSASETSLADLGGFSAYSSFTSSAGGGSETG